MLLRFLLPFIKEMHIFFRVVVLLLNYFWLSMDPEQCAAMYCDQHCFKIGMEIIESVWDGVLVLAPELDDEATEMNISRASRAKRHSKPGCMWHPLSVWNAACRANMKRSLINADAIFKEHLSRTGKSHSAWQDCRFLLERVDSIDFMSTKWKKWYATQNGIKSDVTPKAAKPKDLEARRKWCEVHAPAKGVNRNECEMTEPPQCINESQQAFAGCKVPGDVVTAYTRYYIAKASTVRGGLRYYYTSPPMWLVCGTECEIKTKQPLPEYDLDDEGYAVIEWPEGY